MTEAAQAAAVEAAAADTSTQTAQVEAPKDASDPSWLPSRLARHEKSVAKKFGAESVEELEAKVAKWKELEQQHLSDSEKLRLRNAELEAMASEHGEYKQAVAMQAAEAMASLTQEQRDAVEDIAGESPAKQLRAILKLRPTWKAPEKVASAPIPAPATSAPAVAAPAPTASRTENHLAVWEGLKKTNPMAAAYYLDRHQVEIVEARKARQ